MIKIQAVVKHRQRGHEQICLMDCVHCRTPCVKYKKYQIPDMPERAFAAHPPAPTLPILADEPDG